MDVLLDKIEVGTGAPYHYELRRQSRRRWRWGAVAVSLFCVLSCFFVDELVTQISSPSSSLRRLAGSVPWHDLAGELPPELPTNAQWLTAQSPPNLASLRGQVVLIHFTGLC